ncbi:MAG: glycerate kinase, partial [Desulfovibrionaceae bacterium]
MDLERDIRDIALAGIAGADPERALREQVTLDGVVLCIAGERYDLSRFERVLLFGAGKAAARMAHVLESILGEALSGGVIIIKHGHREQLDRVRQLEAGHPVPDRRGVQAAAMLLKAAKDTTSKDLVLFVLTGGASALTPLPAPPLTLEEKQEATGLLLSCGATIHEVNAVRKHLSLFKGGQLARAFSPSTTVTLMVSDVVGDDLDVIGSGPTAPDPSTFTEALKVIRDHGLEARMPAPVMDRLFAGARGELDDTPEAGDPCFAKVRNLVVCSNRHALDAAAARAERLGYTPLVLTSRLQGEAREVSRALLSIAEEVCATGTPLPSPCCLLAGGETTVSLRGEGRGGRNQELALSAVCALSGSP